MRHLTLVEYGTFLGVTGDRLTVTGADQERWETPLSRLRSIRIAKKGISLSADLALACAARGIRVFFLDWRHVAVAALVGNNQHAVCAVRKKQFEAVDSPAGKRIAFELIVSKIRNQRAVLLYFAKYLSKSEPGKAQILKSAAATMEAIAEQIGNRTEADDKDWREALMGREGAAALSYWNALRDADLLGSSFRTREGRGSAEITNAALNYGYSILMSQCWSALENAGLELYAGVLHTPRPGKPSLVLDFMEEYRAWVVDRNIIKLRKQLAGKAFLTTELKAAITNAIDDTMSMKIAHRSKLIRLENIMQRQAYRLAGAMVDTDKRYRSQRFKW